MNLRTIKEVCNFEVSAAFKGGYKQKLLELCPNDQIYNAINCKMKNGLI
jgi:hypothetical protein